MVTKTTRRLKNWENIRLQVVEYENAGPPIPLIISKPGNLSPNLGFESFRIA